ncbi:MAG: adenosylcobinamide amidohydrolase [Halodesulfurarchaeum sp.]|nr:adenosylcobinamide amidohydrolase [Halodesulfurarchaeum sp.]
MFETEIRDGVFQARSPGGRWLLTGWSGGYTDADAVYNVSVPEGWDRTDLAAYTTERREAAGFDTPGRSLLTGVDMKHAVGAELDGVRVVATVGLSNPAHLPLEPDGTVPAGLVPEESPETGTVNLLVGTERALADGALATLLGVAVEAKTATLQGLTGFSGTTSDAVAVGTDPDGVKAAFAGSATVVGDATRAAVREAVRGSFESRFATEAPPTSVDSADAGIVTSRMAEVFDP